MNKKKATSDFSIQYHTEAAALIKEFFKEFPEGVVEGSWGPFGKYRFTLQGEEIFFVINEDWFQRPVGNCVIIGDIDSLEFCNSVREITEHNAYGVYIGENEPGWSARWLDAIKSAVNTARTKYSK